jgi:hypothetical protein
VYKIHFRSARSYSCRACPRSIVASRDRIISDYHALCRIRDSLSKCPNISPITYLQAHHRAPSPTHANSVSRVYKIESRVSRLHNFAINKCSAAYKIHFRHARRSTTITSDTRQFRVARVQDRKSRLAIA